MRPPWRGRHAVARASLRGLAPQGWCRRTVARCRGGARRSTCAVRRPLNDRRLQVRHARCLYRAMIVRGTRLPPPAPAAACTLQLLHAPWLAFSHLPNSASHAHGRAPLPNASGSSSAQR
eukprot:2411536-Pleurochrysis_carterae.AAC.2